MISYPRNSFIVSDNNGKLSAGIVQNYGFPKGSIIMWNNKEIIPQGWVECNGQNGTPDLRGRFPLSDGLDYTLGDKGGEEKVSLGINQIPRHTHIFTDIKPSDCRNGTFSGTSGCWMSGPPEERSITTSLVGGSQPHNNMPPYYVLRFIMKT